MSTGKVVNSDDFDSLIIGAVLDDIEHVSLVHTELAAALYVGYTYKHGENLTASNCCVVD